MILVTAVATKTTKMKQRITFLLHPITLNPRWAGHTTYPSTPGTLIPSSSRRTFFAGFYACKRLCRLLAVISLDLAVIGFAGVSSDPRGHYAVFSNYAGGGVIGLLTGGVKPKAKALVGSHRSK